MSGAAGRDTRSIRTRSTGRDGKTDEAHKKRPALNAGLFEVRYSLRVAKWPGIPLTPGGWGADVFRHRVIPSHRGNNDVIAGQLGRRWASLRRKCGFCDISIAAAAPAVRCCRNQAGSGIRAGPGTAHDACMTGQRTPS